MTQFLTPYSNAENSVYGRSKQHQANFSGHFEYDAGQFIKIPASLFVYFPLAFIWHLF